MTTHAITKPPAAEVIADLIEALDGKSDLIMADDLRFFHVDYMMLVGDHSWQDGWCWCQPTETAVHTDGGFHEHPVHVDRSH